MTDKEILKKAIEKVNNSNYPKKWGWPEDDRAMDMVVQERGLYIIFSHSFAKAFWGEEYLVDLQDRKILKAWKERPPNSQIYKAYIRSGEKRIMRKPKEGDTKLWQYHLQQMVLKENPIKYLEQFL